MCSILNSSNAGARTRDEQKVAELAHRLTTKTIDTPIEPMCNGKNERTRGTAARRSRTGLGQSKSRNIQSQEAELHQRSQFSKVT